MVAASKKPAAVPKAAAKSKSVMKAVAKGKAAPKAKAKGTAMKSVTKATRGKPAHKGMKLTAEVDEYSAEPVEGPTITAGDRRQFKIALGSQQVNPAIIQQWVDTNKLGYGQGKRLKMNLQIAAWKD